MSLGEGGRGIGQKDDKVWHGGRGVNRKSDVTHPKIHSNQFSFLQLSIFKSPQSFLKIDPFWPSKFLKRFLTTYSLANSVAFQRSAISSYHCCFHPLVTSHRFPIGISSIIPVQAVFITFFSVKSLSLFGEWHGGEGGREKRWQSVTWGGGGLKNGPFWSDILFAWPHCFMTFGLRK